MKEYLKIVPDKSSNKRQPFIGVRLGIEWVTRIDDATADYEEAAKATQKELKNQLGLETTLVEKPDPKLMKSRWVICKSTKAWKVQNHPKVVDWPPQPGGTNVTVEHPQSASQAVVKNVYHVRGKSFPLTCTFKGNEFTYDVQTKDEIFARKLAAEFSKKIGSTLEQLGNLDIDF